MDAQKGKFKIIVNSGRYMVEEKGLGGSDISS